ncbi:MAG: FAD-dependent monooxygenase [Acidimicrobiaceae bacterium]|jgi:kynurenine 3-monooxygenase|nr:FAD-dependent monooxygenase [Acidimicrobiaceae bacterium]MBT5581850.1 FAD-dependent monooxygenase [Acidimicrobiaceae bacterium]MBT5850494.1 FAD-dependent monooxygenase [Acidimicrobiaceae bacterium]
MKGPIAIAGAGPAGSLLAIYLARQGYGVTVYESRPDLRRAEIGAGRSINLALATRGIVPLVDVGVIDKVNEITIPMRGRMVHAVGDPTPALQPYGSHEHEVIHSVSRRDLNAILLDAAEATGRVTIEFERRLDAIDFDQSLLHFHDGTREPFGVVFGADGANSPIRESIIAKGACTFDDEALGHQYKELTVPAAGNGTYLLDPLALHIWPRGEFMLIALANPGGDFTVTLFAPTQTFDTLNSVDEIQSFFAEHFLEFAALVPDLETQFVENPTGKLATVRVSGWSYQDRAVLIGDAAHGIVPFHGQGMNAAMESVRELDRHLRASPDDLVTAFNAYETERKPNTDAIAEMALNNYVEMRAGVVDPAYLAKRTLALELQRRHPSHLSPRYNMVMFSTMPYAEAQDRATQQGEIIDAALADPSLDVDALISALPLLPKNDPLADPRALSTS